MQRSRLLKQDEFKRVSNCGIDGLADVSIRRGRLCIPFDIAYRAGFFSILANWSPIYDRTSSMSSIRSSFRSTLAFATRTASRSAVWSLAVIWASPGTAWAYSASQSMSWDILSVVPRLRPGEAKIFDDKYSAARVCHLAVLHTPHLRRCDPSAAPKGRRAVG
jgi:hypothetical protein